MTASGRRDAGTGATGYEFLDHTADAGIAARGHTLAELFEQVAAGMYALMIEDLAAVRPAEVRSVEVHADEPDTLLVAWLLELLFMTEAEGLLFSRFEVALADQQHSLRGRAWGEPFDVDRHHVEVVVKAVTRHGLAITHNDGYRAEVIFDI